MPSTTTRLLAAASLALGLSAPAIAPGPVQAAPAPVTAAAPSVAAAQAAPTSAGYAVRLTSFNILTSAIAPGGLDRARRAAKWVQGEGAVVAGFQEVAEDQLRQLQRTMVGYNFWPRRTLGSRGSAIQVSWKQAEVRAVRSGYVMRPFLDYQRPIPYMRFRDRDTGRAFWVMVIHNAPSSREAERDISTRKEIAQIKRMLGTGDPVFAIGDVNERSEFCDRVAAATPLISMNGGTQRRPCPVPPGGGPDWMLGARAAFSDFAKVRNGISDHPALTALARVPRLR